MTKNSVEAFGNTTSQPWNQSTAVTELGLSDMISDIYGDEVLPIYVGTLCPRPLLLNIISINHLRREGPAAASAVDPGGLLEDIDGFSPADWTVGKATAATRPQWLLLGCVYQSAVALYCVLSLQSAGVLRPTARTAALDASHYERLMQLLRRALVALPHLRHSMMWPLAVAGIRAARGGAEDRRFVVEQLAECSRVGGTALPLQATEMLRSFWASGKTGWDDCFERSYVFAA